MSGNVPGGALESRLREGCRKLLSQQPALQPLEPHLLRVRDWYARTVIGVRRLRHRLRYTAPADPYRLIHVDPSTVERVLPMQQAKFREAGTVVGGDWDQTPIQFTDLDVYRAYEQRFEAGVPWTETAFYDRIVDEIEDGDSPWGCESEAAFRERCRRLERLYDRIADDGYRTQAELAEDGATDPIKDSHRLRTERLKDEIAVHVGRDGELLFADGRNRLSMVKLLGLESVPVRVLRRHTEWQAVRDAYARGVPAAERFAGHPDLEDLSFGE